VRRRLIPALFAGFVIAAIAVLVPVKLFARHPEAPGKPSIVFILTDDQRWDTLGSMRTVTTELKAHGVDFTNAFVDNSLCCPSRASILTGQYSHSTGVWQNKGPLGGFHSFHQDRSTVATWLRGAGYHTALFGKYLNGYEGTYVPPGWEHWAAIAGEASPYDLYYKYKLNVDGKLVPYGNRAADYSTNVLASMADDYIRTTTGPLFVYFAPYAPHTPTSPAPGDAVPNLAPFRPPNYGEADVSDKPAWVRRIPPIAPDRAARIDALRERTYATLRSVDRAVGGILDALQATGRLHDSLIVFTSDNGFAWGEHRWADKESPYEESIRVPLVVRDDALVKAPRTDQHLVQNIDFASTFAALAGLAAPGAQGRNFLPLLADPTSSWRQDLLVEHMADEGIPSYCEIRSPRYAYMVYSTGEQELYDLADDPYELTNRAADPSLGPVLRGLRATVHELCNPPPPRFPRRP
jgi:arylsulfatase A-like enzyme